MKLQTAELKDCPFCDAKAEIYFEEYTGEYTIYCTECTCFMPDLSNTLEKAKEIWNRRATND